MHYNQHGSNNDIRKKIEDYSYGLKDEIGRGFSSTVYHGINERTKEQVAIKVIDLKKVKETKAGKQLLQGEIEALRLLSHPNLMKCHDIFTTVNNCYIITEFCNEGDLECLVKKKGGKLSEEETIPIFRDIFQGFRFIAESKFLHRDLKPANILLKDKVGKIADFGFTKKVTSNLKQANNVGSPLYMSPESLAHNIYTVKSDIWGLGVLLYEILHGRAPWECSSEPELQLKIRTKNISLLMSLSQDLKDFIKRCLTVDEDKRISLSQLSKHPFIRRILEDDDLPKLLKKPTTGPENRQKDGKEVREKEFQFPSNDNGNPSQNRPPLQSIFHRGNNTNISPLSKAEKQVAVHINWMRFLFHFNEMFPCLSKSLKYTLGLRYIIVKQLFCQLETLKIALSTKDNLLHIEHWKQFLADGDKIQKYSAILDDYSFKYEKLKESHEQWGKFIIRDKRLSQVVDQNFVRSENLSILGALYAIEQCKQLWAQITSESRNLPEGDLPQQLAKSAGRIDFAISYYQINNILLDRFTDSQFFAKNSKIDIILEFRPAVLGKQNLVEIGHKLELLDMLKVCR